LAKELQSQTVSIENLRKTLSYKKAACIFLVKLTPEVDEVVENVSLGQFLLQSLGSSFETGLVEDILARESV